MPLLRGWAGEAARVRVRVFGGGADDDHGLVPVLHRVQRHILLGLWDAVEEMTTTLPFALARRWLALADPGLRRRAMAADLQELDAQSFALFLQYVLAHRDRGDVRALYLDVVVVTLGSEVPAREVRRDLVARLGQDPLWPVFAYLSDAPEGPLPAALPEQPYEFEDVPLGVRKARARLRDLDTLFKIAADPDPGVIRILLENPMSTEDHALRVASLRPQSRGNFLEVLRSRFGVRERVQTALASNPFCPVRLAVGLTPLLTRVHLEEVHGAPLLDPRVREAARVLLTGGP